MSIPASEGAAAACASWKPSTTPLQRASRGSCVERGNLSPHNNNDLPDLKNAAMSAASFAASSRPSPALIAAVAFGAETAPVWRGEGDGRGEEEGSSEASVQLHARFTHKRELSVDGGGSGHIVVISAPLLTGRQTFSSILAEKGKSWRPIGGAPEQERRRGEAGAKEGRRAEGYSVWMGGWVRVEYPGIPLRVKRGCLVQCAPPNFF